MGNLDTISVEYLRRILADVDDAAATKRLMAAITYKEFDELTQKDVAELYGFSSSWVSKWFRRLDRLDEEPFEEVIHDKPRTGRPSALSDQEYEQFAEVLQAPPREAGIDAPAWTLTHACQYLRDEFDVDYSRRHVRRLLTELGLSAWRVRWEDIES